MSSPLESLKKNKKVPLNSLGRLNNNAPYRKSSCNPDALLNNTLQNHAEHTRSDKDNNRSGKHFQAPSDMELLSSMAGRLAQTEQQLRLCTREIIDKDKKIRILEEKVQLLEKARGYGSETVHDLERKCKSLQEQVHDMEEFLADYGMIWVGPDNIPSGGAVDEFDVEPPSDTRQASRNTPGLWNPEFSVASKSFEVDFNLVVKNVNELNMLSGGDSAVISRTRGGATLKVRDPVPLTLYANGILMFSGPFRPYSDNTTQRCVQDIMDGYFPSELQTRYPDGVPIKVIDKREVVFNDRRTEILFPGSGQLLDSDKQTPSRYDSKTKIHTLDEMTQNPDSKVSVDKFLQNLPPSVIRNGKIIDVRSGIADSLKSSSESLGENQVSLIDTPVVQEIKARAQSGGERPLSGHQVTTLRIKSEKGDQTYILKLKFTDTIASVRKYINKVRPDLCNHYYIKTSFPNKVHDNHTLTLEQAGLVPNATLHILVRG